MQLHIGLTGGIGAGKSTVANMLAQRGAHIIDADQLAREVLEPGSNALKQIAHTFGSEFLNSAGELERQALGQLVFNNPEELARLNQIVHPAVGELTRKKLEQAPADAIIVHDIPLLTENKLQAHYHLVLVVRCAEQIRLQRLVEQRGMDPADARARMAAQATDEERGAIADAFISTHGALADTAAQVEQLWHGRILPMQRHMVAQIPAPPTSPRRLVPHPGAPRTWHQQAENLRRRLEYVLHQAGFNHAQDFSIDHIGPTAVPGMWAENNLELQIQADDRSQLARISAELTAAGYPRASVPGDEPVHRSADPAREFTVYLREQDSAAAGDALAERERLRSSISERLSYGITQALLVRGQGTTAVETNK